MKKKLRKEEKLKGKNKIENKIESIDELRGIWYKSLTSINLEKKNWIEELSKLISGSPYSMRLRFQTEEYYIFEISRKCPLYKHLPYKLRNGLKIVKVNKNRLKCYGVMSS